MEKTIVAISSFLPRKSRAEYKELWLHDYEFIAEYGISKSAYLFGLLVTVGQILWWAPSYLALRIITLCAFGGFALAMIRQGALNEDLLVLVVSLALSFFYRTSRATLRAGLIFYGLAEALTFAMFSTAPLRFRSAEFVRTDGQQVAWFTGNIFWLVALLCFTAISCGAITFAVWALSDLKSTFLLLFALLDFGAFWLARWGVVVSSPQSELWHVPWVQSFNNFAMYNYSNLQRSLQIVGVIGFIGLLWLHYRRSKRVMVI